MNLYWGCQLFLFELLLFSIFKTFLIVIYFMDLATQQKKTQMHMYQFSSSLDSNPKS